MDNRDTTRIAALLLAFESTADPLRVYAVLRARYQWTLEDLPAAIFAAAVESAAESLDSPQGLASANALVTAIKRYEDHAYLVSVADRGAAWILARVFDYAGEVSPGEHLFRTLYPAQLFEAPGVQLAVRVTRADEGDPEAFEVHPAHPSSHIPSEGRPYRRFEGVQRWRLA